MGVSCQGKKGPGRREAAGCWGAEARLQEFAGGSPSLPLLAAAVGGGTQRPGPAAPFCCCSATHPKRYTAPDWGALRFCFGAGRSPHPLRLSSSPRVTRGGQGLSGGLQGRQLGPLSKVARPALSPRHLPSSAASSPASPHCHSSAAWNRRGSGRADWPVPLAACPAGVALLPFSGPMSSWC